MQEQLSLLNRISDELNSDLHPDRMLQRVLSLTVAHLNATTGSVMLFDHGNRVSSFILQQEALNSETAARIVGTVLTEGFAGWVLNHGEGGVIHDTYQDERWIIYDDQPYDVRSAIATPLRRRQRIIGVLTLVHDEPNRFKDSDLLLLNAIADQSAIALENAQLFRETEQEREKLSAIISSTQDAVLVTDQENKTLLLNPAALEILGLEEPVQGMPLVELIHDEELLNLMSPAAPNAGEIELPDGRIMWGTVTAIPGVGQVTMLRDISSFKALDKMKRDFVTAFTHDLRTPLATVKGYIELVRMDGPVTTRQEEDLEGITRAANLMKSLIEDLLELSRLEQLNELIREPVRLEDVIRSSLAAIRPLAQSREIDVAINNARKNVIVEGNSVLLSRAVSNLLDNAIKYTPAGGKVQIKLDKQNGQATVSVIDNGPGIKARDLPRVFEKFYRAREELDEIPGTGLGLAIVKTIAEQHSGRVWVESQPNTGSVFTIALPVLENGS